MSLKKVLQNDFNIQTLTVYVPGESNPEQQRYFFAYKVQIKNNGPTTAQLMSRHWIITDAFGHKEEVRGPGVVGLQPKISSGKTFEYESACPLHTNTGSMRGWYHFMDSNGESFEVEIPEFYLVAPSALQ